MMVVKGSPSFSGVKDVRAACSARTWAARSTRASCWISRACCRRRAACAATAPASRQDKTSIDYLFSALQANRYLEEKIFTSITGEDEIADSASSELASIRRLIRAASARVHDALQKIISSPSYAKALQEPIITMRSERYVVPVKAEHKGRRARPRARCVGLRRDAVHRADGRREGEQRVARSCARAKRRRSSASSPSSRLSAPRTGRTSRATLTCSCASTSFLPRRSLPTSSTRSRRS